MNDATTAHPPAAEPRERLTCPHCARVPGAIQPTRPSVAWCRFCHRPFFAGPAKRWIDSNGTLIDLDDDRRLRRPRAWFKAKQAFGSWHMLNTLMLLAELESGQPAMLMAIGLHHFLSAERPDRAAMLVAYHEWTEAAVCGQKAGQA